MGVALYLIILSVKLFSLFVISTVVYFRKEITSMTGMMIAMTIGMSVGLTIGVIFRILFSDSFFIATILGILVGMIAGFLAGIPLSVIAVLDGILSGLMGGMMGAMLGEMITIEYHDAMIKIMFFIFLSMILILLRMIHQEVNHKVNFIRSLFTIFVVFGFFFIVFELFDAIFIYPDAIKNE